MATSTAEVLVHDVVVGQLERLDEDENYIFRFDEDWLTQTRAPVLGQLFEDRRPHDLRTSGLPCWFAHLLPQGPWRRHLQRWAKLDSDDDDDFDLLVAIGYDLPGALNLEPATASIFRPSQRLPREAPREDAYRFSLAGAQWKLSIHHRNSRLTIPVFGETGEHIAKFSSPRFPDLPRVEHATTSWARLAGLNVHATKLVAIDAFEGLPDNFPDRESHCLVLDRFDRSPSGRVHMEDFGQLIDRPPSSLYKGSYEELAALVRWLCPEDAQAFVRQLVFVIACGNGDAHLKNWSVIYPDRRKPRLSPGYDLVSTVVYQPRDMLALKLAGDQALQRLKRADLEALAANLGRSHEEVCRWAGEALGQIRTTWAKEKNQLDFRQKERARVDAHLISLETDLTIP